MATGRTVKTAFLAPMEFRISPLILNAFQVEDRKRDSIKERSTRACQTRKFSLLHWLLGRVQEVHTGADSHGKNR